MKLINKFKSPNYDKRKFKKILFIIVHYTALKDHFDAISHLCDPANKVSSHYLISQNGQIFKLLDEKKRAWHAGISFWDGFTDLNSLSIGIELDFSPKDKNNTFSKKLINSLLLLIKKLKIKYDIQDSNILGHSDIAPFRKKDPGPRFPWHIINDEYLSYKKYSKKLTYVKRWFFKHNIKSKKKIIIFILSYIGYNTLKIKSQNYLFKNLLISYQSHYLQFNITGKADNVTTDFIISHFLNKLLTKK